MILCPVCDIASPSVGGRMERCCLLSLAQPTAILTVTDSLGRNRGANSKIRQCLAKKYANLNHWLSRLMTPTAVLGAWTPSSTVLSSSRRHRGVPSLFFVVLLGHINTRRLELKFDCVFESCFEIRNVLYFEFISVSIHGINVICQVSQQ